MRLLEISCVDVTWIGLTVYWCTFRLIVSCSANKLKCLYRRELTVRRLALYFKSAHSVRDMCLHWLCNLRKLFLLKTSYFMFLNRIKGTIEYVNLFWITTKTEIQDCNGDEDIFWVVIPCGLVGGSMFLRNGMYLQVNMTSQPRGPMWQIFYRILSLNIDISSA
jgi:hypothetical protein